MPEKNFIAGSDETSDAIVSPKQIEFIGPGELGLLESLVRSGGVNVLTIMFTDIKGFTEMTEVRGEQYSTRLRRIHDEILAKVIVAAGGTIIKHIGDSVMAVFLAPSKAVEASLHIQEEIRKFNAKCEIDHEILVRIGLDMGQVTLEQAAGIDVFGRHVNRAARVESLAEGGQVLLTFPVIDSARGWLSSLREKNVEWVSHGNYSLKGIIDPVEIFEVFDRNYSLPQAPPLKRADKLRGAGKKMNVTVIFLAVIISMLVSFYAIPTSVWFTIKPGGKVVASELYLDGDTKLVLEGSDSDQTRRALIDIRPGRHILRYDTIDYARYYSDEFIVSRGRNFIEPKFNYYGLPAAHRKIRWPEGEHNIREEYKLDESESFVYNIIDENNTKKENKTEVKFSLSMDNLTGATGEITCKFGWKITLNDKLISDDKDTMNGMKRDEQITDRTKVINIDKIHKYKIYYRFSGKAADIYFESHYLDDRSKHEGYYKEGDTTEVNK